MNETVIKLVNMLFSETEMTQEAQALHDELLANCHERFNDALAEGKSEDDAIGCVVESLKGMEDVIGAYPKKQSAEPDDDWDDDDDVAGGARTETAQSEYRFSADEISALDIDVRDASIEIDSTSGDEYIVTLDEEARRTVKVCQKGGSICVSNSESSRHGGSFGWLLNLVVSFSVSGCVKIGVPDGRRATLVARSMSGDISAVGAELLSADVSTTSGSVTLKPSPATRLSFAKVNSASGDIALALCADVVNAKTMSGEVRMSCEAREINASSISGDVKLKGGAEKASFKSVSGDIRWKCLGAGVKQVDANTTSGDVRIKLPSEISSVRLTANTVSGDIRNDFSDHGTESEVTIRANSVSGDIAVTRKDA